MDVFGGSGVADGPVVVGSTTVVVDEGVVASGASLDLSGNAMFGTAGTGVVEVGGLALRTGADARLDLYHA